MNGSQKQIEWAGNIIADLEKKSECLNADGKKYIADLQSKITHAGAWIHLFGGRYEQMSIRDYLHGLTNACKMLNADGKIEINGYVM